MELNITDVLHALEQLNSVNVHDNAYKLIDCKKLNYRTENWVNETGRNTEGARSNLLPMHLAIKITIFLI